MTVRKFLLATGAAALMSSPAWAHPGNGNGDHGNQPGNAPSHTDKGKGHDKGNGQGNGKGQGNGPSEPGKPHEHPGQSHKCVAHSVGYVASGTLVSQSLVKDAGAETYSGKLEVEVAHTNHHASGDKGKTVTYEVSKVRVVFGLKDTNKDGSVGLDDLAKGDRVHLIGKITAIAPKCKGEFTATKTIMRIAFHAPAGPKGKS